MKIRTPILLVPHLTIAVVLAFVIGEMLLIWLSYDVNVPLNDPMLQKIRSYMGIGWVVFMLYYAMERINRTHPFKLKNYLQWLELTPWTPRQPLPLGPVLVVWQDVLLLAAVTLVGWGIYGLNPLAPTAGFAAGYATAAIAPLSKTGARLESLALRAGLPLMILTMTWPAAAFAAGLLLAAIAYIGLRRSLARFPWPREEPKFDPHSLEWPFNRLGPVAPSAGVAPGEGIGIGLLIAWWVTAILFQVEKTGNPLTPQFVTSVSGVLGSFIALIRWVRYRGHYHPPISLWGRFATRQYIIPRFDVVEISPLLTLAAGWILPHICWRLNLTPLVALDVCLVAIIALATEVGPTFENWRLTGAHSMPPAPQLRLGTAD